MSTLSFLQWLFYLNVLTVNVAIQKRYPYESGCSKGTCSPGAHCIQEIDEFTCKCKEGTQTKQNIICSNAEDCASANCGHYAYCFNPPISLPRWCYCAMDRSNKLATQCLIEARSDAEGIVTGRPVNTNTKAGTFRHITVNIYNNRETYTHITSSVLDINAYCTIVLKYYPNNSQNADSQGLLKKLKCYNANSSSELYVNRILERGKYQVTIKTPAKRTDYWKCEVHFTQPGAIPIAVTFRARYSSNETPQTAEVFTTTIPFVSVNAEHADSNSMNIATLVTAIMATLGFLALVMWLVYRIYKRRQRLHLARASTDINYESLPDHREGPMALPPQWDTHTRKHTQEENLYSDPYAEKNHEQNMYTQPIPRSLRPPPIEPVYTEISLEDGRPTISSENSRSAMPDRPESVMQTNYMYEGTQGSEQNYVNVAPKNQNKMKSKCPVPGKRTYVNELDFQAIDYVEPAYCEIPESETRK